MKRFICGIIAIILCLSLTACGGPGTTTITAEPEDGDVKLSFLPLFMITMALSGFNAKARPLTLSPIR